MTDSPAPLTRASQAVRAFRSVGVLGLFGVNIISLQALFSPQSIGIWIAGAFLIPPVIFLILRGKVKSPETMRMSFLSAMFFTMIALTILAFISLTFAYLSPDDPLFFKLIAAQVLLCAIGLVAAYLRHSPDRLADNIAARYDAKGDHIAIRKSPAAIVGYGDTSGSVAIDWVIKLAYWAYSALVLVGMLLGGGAPLIILDILGASDVAGPSGPGVHFLAVTGLGLVALPILGYGALGFWRQWRALAQLEKSATNPHYIWDEDKAKA